MGKGGGGALVLNIIYYIFIKYFCNVIVGSSPWLGSHPVVFSLVVHLYCIECLVYRYVCSILTAQLK